MRQAAALVTCFWLVSFLPSKRFLALPLKCCFVYIGSGSYHSLICLPVSQWSSVWRVLNDSLWYRCAWTWSPPWQTFANKPLDTLKFLIIRTVKAASIGFLVDEHNMVGRNLRLVVINIHVCYKHSSLNLWTFCCKEYVLTLARYFIRNHKTDM